MAPQMDTAETRRSDGVVAMKVYRLPQYGAARARSGTVFVLHCLFAAAFRKLRYASPAAWRTSGRSA